MKLHNVYIKKNAYFHLSNIIEFLFRCDEYGIDSDITSRSKILTASVTLTVSVQVVRSVGLSYSKSQMFLDRKVYIVSQF